MDKLDTFTRAYIECALWSSTDDDCQPLDRLTIDDLAPECLEKMRQDCAAFQETEADSLALLGDDSQNGHDFCLTRNRHGAGFWDRGYTDKKAIDSVVASSHAYGDFNLYVGDDGKIHGM